MLKRLENKLIMLKAVLTLLRQNYEALHMVQAFSDLLTRLEGLISQISKLRQVTESDNTGITDEKAEQQEMLIEKVYELSSALYAVAVAQQDRVLQAKVGFSQSNLRNQRENELIDTCTSVAELSNRYLDALINSGITQDDLMQLENLKNAFSGNLSTHRVTVAEQKAANEKMKQLFNQADGLLKDQVDRMMVRFKKGNPDLYAAYKNARKLVNYGIRHEKPDNVEEAKGE